MDYSTPEFPVHHQRLELAQTHVHQVSDAIQLQSLVSSNNSPLFLIISCMDLERNIPTMAMS